MRKFFLHIVFAAALAVAARPYLAAAADASGTFVQLSPGTAKMSAAWAADFGQMKQIGIDTVIVQWSAEEGISYFTNDLPFAEFHTSIEAILRAAEQEGMGVYLGLQRDPRYWDHVTSRERVLKDYFEVRIAQNEKLQLEMLKRLGTRASWKGYYIPDEIDDINWRISEKTPIMRGYIARMSESLHANDDGRAILASAFYRMRTAPDVFASNLADLVGGSRLTRILVQDGLGAGISWKYAERYVPVYYEALARALATSGVSLGIVVEAFARASSPGEPFAAGPAAPERVGKQLEMAERHARQIVYFTFPNYIDPDLRSPAAATLYEALKASAASRQPAPEGADDD